jgi:hypothetical protein
MELSTLPGPHGLAVLALIGIALFLFTREWIPLETSSLAVLVLLAAGFELFPYAADGVQLHAGYGVRGTGAPVLSAP